MEQLSVGRIVWYCPTNNELDGLSGIDYDQFYDDGYLPAIVIKGAKDGEACLKVFAQNDFIVLARYNKDGAAGTWCWPTKSK